MEQGDIYLTDFEPSVGREYKKERPAIIISGAAAIKNAPLITVMPITSNVNRKRPEDILISKDPANNLHKDSMIRVADIHSFDKRRLISKLGTAQKSIMQKIKDYIPKHFDL
ncbi:type II toxin-antitoxin system PemK/MazF family toxin [Candidatus Peregrinibacteria bacterium]|nr:type II toxin-antitoxin system PemK/MazF family toxin [Candidatus Peregrinibacteria bacterium]